MNKYISFISIILALVASGFVKISKTDNFIQTAKTFGYIDKGDSIEFRFGDQKNIKVGILNIDLDKRRNEIKKVNLAGDFNGWNPNNANYALRKIDEKIFSLVVSKKSIGQKGETHKFKFVLNGVYWIEPPEEAINKITGTDRNTNLLLKL
jgi:D-alanyl-D-alanine-carboxypeptidase/D-alanyl-D-alanine-endopeptidase